MPISIENDWQEDPRSVSDGAGGAIFTWQDWRNTIDDDIYSQRIDSSGIVQWADNGVAISTGPGRQAYPDITTDGAAGAIIAWDDGRNGPTDISAQRVDSSGNVLWAAGGIGVATKVWSESKPMVVSDGVGGAIITWEDWNSSSSDIYAQRLNGSGTALWDIGGAPVCSVAVAGKRAPTIASDSASGAIITWYGGGDIFAQWIDSLGNVQWTADALAICTADGNQYFPTIVNDGEGGVIITWQGQGDFGGGIYAQKVALQPTGVEERSTPVVSYIQISNHPNPFSIVTEFRFRLPRESEVSIEIFDIAGKRVFSTQLPSSPAGWASFLFDGRDLSGKVLPSGVYFSRITAGGLNATKKIVIAK
ncbi:MAG: T9SS type A sorting domain-containing protein [Candidatus Krumholzibacteria bacterium]|nr:T9SS type A sorting domain-containing protein [Candidatus Krumholzibacteria bacterium]